MRRREFFAGAGIPLAARAAAPRSSRRPNIMLVFTDQQTYRAMSCAGNPLLHTPAMDALAAKGVRFETAYTAFPVCGPARGTLLTGRFPHQHGVEWNERGLAPGTPTLGSIFREAGYRTVWAGKWHLDESYPLRKGSRQTKIDDFELLPFYDSNIGYPQWGTGDITDEPLAEATARFLREQGSRQPFALGVSFCNPHDCCMAASTPERYPNAQTIQGPLPPVPANHAVDPNEPEFVQDKRYRIQRYRSEILRTRNWGDPEWRAYVWNYLRMAERVDKALGKVFRALDESGLRERTLVIFTSDHGDGVASHRWTAKLNFYEESTRVPFMISWPGVVPEGRTERNALVSHVDILPTFCDYAGIKPPAGLPGQSLRALIEKPGGAARDYIVTELADDPRAPARKGRMIRMGQYKYCVYSQGARNEQLFDLLYDPGETQNLVGESAMAPVKAKLRQRLDAHLESTGDDFKPQV